jgi:hypothetical protein
MKQRDYDGSTRVPPNGRLVVPQPLTVLLSYNAKASVPLWESVNRTNMAHMTRNQAREKGAAFMPSVYAAWLGQTVILQVAAGDLRVPLRGIIVGESDRAIRFRIGECWDIDIFKTMVLAVEEDNYPQIVMN